MKIPKKNIFFWGGGGYGRGGVRLGGRGQGGLERRIEAFVKIQKKEIFLFCGGVGSGGALGWGSGWM